MSKYNNPEKENQSIKAGKEQNEMQNYAERKIMQLYQIKGKPYPEHYSWVCLKWRKVGSSQQK